MLWAFLSIVEPGGRTKWGRKLAISARSIRIFPRLMFRPAVWCLLCGPLCLFHVFCAVFGPKIAQYSIMAAISLTQCNQMFLIKLNRVHPF